MKVKLKEEHIDNKTDAFNMDFNLCNNIWLVLDEMFDMYGGDCYKVNAKNGYCNLGYWLLERSHCEEVPEFKIELPEDLFEL